MTENSLSLFSYEKIREIWTKYCITEIGKKNCQNLFPCKDIKEIEKRLDLFDNLFSYIQKGGEVPSFVCDDIVPFLDRLKPENSTLDRMELFNLMQTLEGMETLSSVFRSDSKLQNRLFSLVSSLYPLSELLSIFHKTFDSKGDIRDDASPELYNIRTSKERVKERLKKRTDSFLKENKFESNFFIWENRVVVLVPAKDRHFFNGIVHGYSSTGYSIYFEPESFIEDNNELANLISEEENEIRIILLSLSRRVAEKREEILHNLEIVAEFDICYSAVCWAKDTLSVKPVFGNSIEILKARHPLIKDCVPVDIMIPDSSKILIISGPNMGGKSAVLKTTGLFALIAMTGFPVPATYCMIKFFDNIFADIGDEQSLENSLSTFSAHLFNVKKILSEATENSLVLMDEPGSGTEPETGASFAEVLLEHIAKIGCFAVVTTHFHKLKRLAFVNNSFRNAAVDFDAVSGQPLFKIIYDIPGDSHPLEAMKKIGFYPDFIEEVKNRIDKTQQDFSTAVKSLIEERKKIEEERSFYEKRKKETDLLVERLTEKEERLNEKEKSLKKEFRKRIKEFLESARREFEGIVKKIVESGKNTNVIKEAKNFFKNLEDSLPEINEIKKNNKSFATGDVVIVKGKYEGIVEKIENEKVVLKTNVGIVTMPFDEIEKKELKEEKDRVSISVEKSSKFSLELNIVGLRYEDAKKRLDEFLDSAILSGCSFIRIIHGKGTGALRKMTREFLEEKKKNNVIKSYGEPPPESGGSGCTVVEI